MSYSKFKDALPQDTVSQILEIHKQLGLSLDCSIQETVPGIYSAAVSDRIGGWNTCGKGTTNDYCLASAYAESIEHLCSYMAYNTGSLTVEAQQHLGFSRYPDEKCVKISDIPSIAPDVFDDMVDAYCLTGGPRPPDDKVISVWERFLGTSETTLAPYYSVRKNQVVYLPEAIIGVLCGTNGGGAGNTPAEAIGHGLDEISERYVKYKIYHDRLTPPTVDRDFIHSACPELWEIIVKLEEELKYKTVVKDASMGKGFTVVGVLIIDQENQRYMANFGAHPQFEIALERCLTEMFQLFNPKSLKTMRRKDLAKWQHYDDCEIDGIRNWVSLLRDDTGILPDSFFAGTPSWSFTPWKKYKAYSNRIGAQNQLENLLLATEKDIYIRDVSFLGFPVYRIYIPGISTTCLSLDEQQLDAFERGQEMVNAMCATGETNLSREDLVQLRDTVFSHNSFVSALIFRNMNEGMLNAFQAALLMDLGDSDNAFKILRRQDDRLCQCAVKEFELKGNNVLPDVRDGLLELFFGKDEKEFAVCWRSSQIFLSLINKYVIRSNRNLNGNSSRDVGETSRLHMRLKEAMAKNIPNQMEIRKVFC